MRKSVVLASLFCASLMTQPGQAADVYDGVTFEELQSALSAGLDVRAETTPQGNRILFAKGKNHLIGAHVVQCGDGTRCDGVRFLAVLETKPSATFINDFNRKFLYSKLAANDKRDGVISIEAYVGGGVTAENLLRNALLLMVRLSDLQELTVSEARAPTMNLSALRAREGITASASSGRAWAVDPALTRALAEQSESKP